MCGYTLFLMPARCAACLQALRGVFVSIGWPPLCQRLPGKSQTLVFLGKRRQC
jgi:hypothetical protein